MLDFDLKEPYLNVNSNTYFCLPVSRHRFNNTIHANLVHGWRESSSIPYVFMFHADSSLCYIMCVNAINTDTHERFSHIEWEVIFE